jgi:hypothetical protein
MKKSNRGKVAKQQTSGRIIQVNKVGGQYQAWIVVAKSYSSFDGTLVRGRYEVIDASFGNLRGNPRDEETHLGIKRPINSGAVDNDKESGESDASKVLNVSLHVWKDCVVFDFRDPHDFLFIRAETLKQVRKAVRGITFISFCPGMFM